MLSHKIISGCRLFLRIGSIAFPAGKLSVLAAAAVLMPAFLCSSRATAEGNWISANFRDHPLAGTIWTSDFKPVTTPELEKALANARIVLLGEIHDNPDHHRLQAQLIDALVREGRRPAVVFEMILADQQAELDREVKGGATASAGLGKALSWEERGWPDWVIYQPIAEAALAAALPMKAGGLAFDVQQALAKGERSPLYTQTIKDFDLSRPVKAQIAEAEGLEIKEAHCNLLPDTAIPAMMTMQRALDASLAKAVASAENADGAVLIAGAGHVRKDWAVSHIIRETWPNAGVVSVAFVEVDPERTSPSDYMKTVAGLEKPYDFIYLTPRADLTDQCAELAKHFKTKVHEKAQPPE